MSVSMENTRLLASQQPEVPQGSLGETVSAWALRYFGCYHKFLSPSYHFSKTPISEPRQVLPYLRYIASAVTSWAKDESWINPFHLHLANVQDLPDIPGMQKNDRCFYDPKTTLKVTIVEGEGNEVIVSFGSIRSSNSEYSDSAKQKEICEAQYREVFLFLLGKRSPIFAKASHVFAHLKTFYEARGKVLALSGQCLGGALAQYVALEHHVKAYCFNSLPLGAGQQYDLGFSRLNQADQYITQLSVVTDYASDLSIRRTFDLPLQALLLRTPGNFGKRFSLRNAYTKDSYEKDPGLVKRMFETHDYFLGSVMKFIGHDIRTKPEHLSQEELVRFQGVQP